MSEQQSERKRQAAITKVYDKLHEGKLGAHWLWCVIEQVASGHSEEDAMREFGYYSRAALYKHSKEQGWTHEINQELERQYLKGFQAGKAFAVSEQGWRTIESAPRDGATLLLAGKKSRMADGEWHGVAKCWNWPYVNAEPTHWMPLPPPPIETTEEKL